MREYELPLSYRLREAARQRERYRTDPAFRLDRLNRTRVRRGREPLPCLTHAELRLPLEANG